MCILSKLLLTQNGGHSVFQLYINPNIFSMPIYPFFWPLFFRLIEKSGKVQVQELTLTTFILEVSVYMLGLRRNSCTLTWIAIISF